MGEFLGKQLQPRDIAAALEAAWKRAKKPIPDITLCRLTADALGESKGYVGALNDNRNEAGDVWQRDCSFMQIGIAARYIGTAVEARLRTESKDPAVYEPVVAHVADAACNLFYSPWTRDGKPTIRAHQPWFADTLGWATWPEWWVWARPWLDHWAATGRYIQKAIAGVANHKLVNKHAASDSALRTAVALQEHFGVAGTLGIDKKRGIVVWTSSPRKPTTPPPDGVGPRPRPNDGR